MVARCRDEADMDKHRLSHTSWECTCHIVWISKYRRRVLYGETRREIGEILRMLEKHMDGVEIVEGTACADDIHICLRVSAQAQWGQHRESIARRCIQRQEDDGNIE